MMTKDGKLGFNVFNERGKLVGIEWSVDATTAVQQCKAKGHYNATRATRPNFQCVYRGGKHESL